MTNNRTRVTSDVAALDDLASAVRQFVTGAADREFLTDSERTAIAKIYSLGERATNATLDAWVEYQKRVERTSTPEPPPPVRFLGRDVWSFLAVSEESTTIGSAQVATIQFREGRAAVVAEGEKLLDHIAVCMSLARDRNENDRAWRRGRVEFIQQLYSRPETTNLMLAFDALEAIGPEAFEVSRQDGGMLQLLVRTLAAVVSWCNKHEKRFGYGHLPIDETPFYDWRTFRQEWLAENRAER